MSTRTEYAFDFGDEIEDFMIDGGQRDDAEAKRRSVETSKSHPIWEPDLYKHTLMMRTVTSTETEWTPVPEDHHDAADLISVEPS